MLVLSRRCDESIMIGDDIKIVIIGIIDGKVKLGIDAPKTVPVHRSEVYKAIHENKDIPNATGEDKAN